MHLPPQQPVHALQLPHPRGRLRSSQASSEVLRLPRISSPLSSPLQHARSHAQTCASVWHCCCCAEPHLEALRLHPRQLSLHAPSLLPCCTCIVLGRNELQARPAQLTSLQQGHKGSDSARTMHMIGRSLTGALCILNTQSSSPYMVHGKAAHMQSAAAAHLCCNVAVQVGCPCGQPALTGG